MNKKILFLIFSLSLLSLFIINLNQLNTIEGKITEVNYKSFGVLISLGNKEFIILENKILNLSEGDQIKITYTEKEYNMESENVVEKIVKF